MPPKGRPRRTSTRKPNPKAQTLTSPPDKPIDDVVSPQTLTPSDKPIDVVVSPPALTPLDKPTYDVVSPQTLTSPDKPVDDVVSPQTLTETPPHKPSDDVVSSQTLTPADKPSDDVVSSETHTSVAVDGGEAPVMAKCTTTVEGDGGNVGKPKKVVKKTIKVLKKVIKKVPKKVAKQGVDSKGGNVELDIKANSILVKEEEMKCGSSVSGQLKVESRDSGGLVDAVEVGEKNDGLEENKVKVEAKNDKLVPNKVEVDEKSDELVANKVEVDEKSDELLEEKVDVDANNGNFEENKVEVDEKRDGLEDNKAGVDENIQKFEENKVEVDEKNDKLDEVEGERIIEVEGSECMEVDGTLCKNEGDVEERNVVSRMEGEGEKKEVRDGECGKEGEGLGGVVNREEKEGEEMVGEALLSGELGAMERKKRRRREVFIGKLDKDVKEEDVRKVFQEAGKIVDLRLLMNSKTGKKFAFVMYASSEDALRALEKFAKVEICGKEYGADPVEGNDTIFLGNVDKKWTEEDVVQLLKKIGIGKIDKVTVMVDPNNTKCNRGFAFVEFETIKDAQVAYMKLQEKDIFGKNQKLKVAWAEPLKELNEEEMLKVKTVYAEFIPSSWDEEKVRDIFMKFGEIDEIVLARNLTSKRKDFAFIRYRTRVAAIKCIESFDLDLGEENGPKVNVKVSLAKPKSKSKKLPLAKPFASEIPKARLAASHSKVRPSEPRSRMQPSLPHYGIQIPKISSTNEELVHLLREQASWRPTHANLSNGPMDIRHPNPLSGRKRQFSVLETERLHEDMNIYPRSHLDASYSVASSSRSLAHPSGLTNPRAYHQQHVDYPAAGPVYGARNYASNVELRDRALERGFPYRRYPG